MIKHGLPLWEVLLKFGVPRILCFVHKRNTYALFTLIGHIIELQTIYFVDWSAIVKLVFLHKDHIVWFVLVHILDFDRILIALFFVDLNQFLKGLVLVVMLKNGASKRIRNHLSLKEIKKALVLLYDPLLGAILLFEDNWRFTWGFDVKILQRISKECFLCRCRFIFCRVAFVALTTIANQDERYLVLDGLLVKFANVFILVCVEPNHDPIQLTNVAHANNCLH